MSLLTIVQDAALGVGLDEPSSVAAATDVTTKQLRFFAQQEGDELSRSFDWRNLKVQAQITGNGTDEYWDLPDDWDRQMVGENMWLDNEPHIPLAGPLSDQDWLAIQASNTQPSRPVWRYFGDQIQIWPALAFGDTVTLQYLTSHWISASDGLTVRSRWVEDTDYAVMGANVERIMVLGIIWRWKRAKGLDYAEEFNTYQLERSKAQRADGGFLKLVARSQFVNYDRDPRKNMYTVTVP